MLKYEVVIFWSNEDSVFVAFAPELTGCMAHGETREEALQNIQEAIGHWIDIARETGKPTPQPKCSGPTSRPRPRCGSRAARPAAASPSDAPAARAGTKGVDLPPLVAGDETREETSRFPRRRKILEQIL